MGSHLGELAALGTACCWTVTAICFEEASRRIGSLTVNLVRLVIAMIFLAAYTWITRGSLLPTDATWHTWYWLFLSGLIGLSLGDLCLFRALVLIGARRTLLLMSLSPPLTALIGWLVMDEWLSGMDWTGMGLTVGGVSWVILERSSNGSTKLREPKISGIVLGFLAALAQAAGLVLSKFGMGDYDPFAANQIRIIAGIFGFTVLFAFLRRWPQVRAAVKNRPAMAWTATGAFFGTFLGISLSLLAIQLTQAGVAATIMSIMPVLIIPPSIFFFNETLSLRAVMGAFVAVMGVALLFL